MPHSLILLKTLLQNKVSWEEKAGNSLVMSRGDIIRNYFPQMPFDSVIFLFYKSHQECTHGVLHYAITCGLRDIWSPQQSDTVSKGLPRHILCGGWPLEIQWNGCYWLFGLHAQLGEFLLNQSNQVKVVGCASQPYGFEGEWTPPLKLVQSSVWQFNHLSVSGLEYG